MSPAHPLLTIEAESQPGAHVIRIAGELDLAGCPDLESALRVAERVKADRIVLDLEALTFVDSAGLGTLLRASRRSASDGNRLEITRGKGQPAEILRLTGLEKALPLADPALCPSIQEAGDAPGARSMPDDANRPLTGEHLLVGANGWR